MLLGIMTMVSSVVSAQGLLTCMTGLGPRSAEMDYNVCQDWTSPSPGTSSCADENMMIVGLQCADSNCREVYHHDHNDSDNHTYDWWEHGFTVETTII